MNRAWENLTLTLVLLPLLFIYVPNGHDWGGDFAQYIHQAEDLLNGSADASEYYVYNPNYYRLAPPSYPNGWPLLLAGWIAVFGNYIGGLTVFASLFAVLFGMGLYRWLRPYFKWNIALIGVIITLYNPWMIRFKAEVVADLPFAALVMWTVYAYSQLKNGKLWAHIVTPLLVALSILTKTHGWVIPIAFALEGMWWLLWKDSRLYGIRTLYNTILGIGITIVLTSTLNEHAHLSHFAGVAGTGGWASTFLSNVVKYFNIYAAYWVRDLGSYTWIGMVVGHALAIFAAVGMVYKWWKKEFNFRDVVFLGLMAALLLFPITNGFRYLLPAYPMLLVYSFTGLRLLPWHYLKLNGHLPWIAAIGVLAMYYNGWTKIVDLKDVPEGPYKERYAKLHKALQFINADNDVLLIAEKPRVFAYLDKVHAMSIHTTLPQAMALNEVDTLIAIGAENGLEYNSVWMLDIRSVQHNNIDEAINQLPAITTLKGDGWKLIKLP